jgi:hypothetical protein
MKPIFRIFRSPLRDSRLVYKKPVETHDFEDDVIQAKKPSLKEKVKQKKEKARQETRRGLDLLKTKVPAAPRKSQVLKRFEDILKGAQEISRKTAPSAPVRIPEPIPENEIPAPTPDIESIISENPSAVAPAENQEEDLESNETHELTFEQKVDVLANQLKNAIVRMKRRKITGDLGGDLGQSEVQYHYTYNLDKDLLDSAGITDEALHYVHEKFDANVHDLGNFAEQDDLNRVFGTLLAIRQLGTRENVNQFNSKVLKASELFLETGNKKEARRQLLEALSSPLTIKPPEK